jgi:hypothetical protein
VLVSDHNVWRLYGARMMAAFHAAGYIAAAAPAVGYVRTPYSLGTARGLRTPP